jgi:hypothetical protein
MSQFQQTIERDEEHRLLVRRLVGEFDCASLVRALEEFEAAPEFDPDWDVLADFTAARVEITGSDARLLAERQDRMPRTPDRRWAMLVGRDVEYGMGRVTTAYVARAVAQVFRSEAEARAWLAARTR